MYTNFIIIADSAHIDRDGKLHIQGIFEFIKSFKFPCVHVKMALIIQIESTDKKIGPYSPKVQIKNKDGEIIFEFKMPDFNFKNVPKKGTVVRKRLLINLENLLFNKPGPFSINLLIDNKYLDSTKFNVIKLTTIKSGARA